LTELAVAWNQGIWSFCDTMTLPSTSHLLVDHRKLGLFVTSVVEKGWEPPADICMVAVEIGLTTLLELHFNATSW